MKLTVMYLTLMAFLAMAMAGPLFQDDSCNNCRIAFARCDSDTSCQSQVCAVPDCFPCDIRGACPQGPHRALLTRADAGTLETCDQCAAELTLCKIIPIPGIDSEDCVINICDRRSCFECPDILDRCPGQFPTRN